jgi:hypothetical protein
MDQRWFVLCGDGIPFLEAGNDLFLGVLSCYQWSSPELLSRRILKQGVTVFRRNVIPTPIEQSLVNICIDIL